MVDNRQQIKKVEFAISTFHQRKDIDIFFDLVNKLIAELRLDENSEKLSLNVRDDYRNRISFNLNSRLVLAYSWESEKPGLYFMLYKKDIQEQKDKYDFSLLHEFRKIPGRDAASVHVDLQQYAVNPLPLETLWIKCCKEYLPENESSRYRKHNIPLLFELATDSQKRSEFITEHFHKQETIHQMDFFTKEEFDHVAEEMQRSYDGNSPNLKYFDSLRNKLVYFTQYASRELKVRLSEPVRLDRFLKQPLRGQSKARWQDYILVGVAMQGKEMSRTMFIKFVLIDFGTQPKLHIKLDYENGSENLRADERLQNMINEVDQESDLLIDLSIVQPPSWDELLKLTEEKIKTNAKLYERIYDQYHSDGKVSKGGDQAKPSTLNDESLNQILFGPPGTGKTYQTIDLAAKILGFDTGNHDQNKAEFEKMLHNQIEFITFHQSYSYEEFIEGIKPLDPKETEGKVAYKVVPGVMRMLVNRATEEVIDNFDEAFAKFQEDMESETIELQTPKKKKTFKLSLNSVGSPVAKPSTEIATPIVITKELIGNYLRQNKADYYKPYIIAISEHIKSKYGLKIQEKKMKPNYVLIIDEINRGNVSQIFGELITLIEKDKRKGATEELTVRLPYSKEPFSIPQNIYIIGTMNTADRSVEALDTALRRRFSFVEVSPNEEKIKQPSNFEIDLKLLFNTINNRIELLLNKDHKIGHSYFMKINSIEDLRWKFQNQIIPLLQEYFYGDMGKIGLILGNEFVETITPSQRKNNFFADFKYELKDELLEKQIFHLRDMSKLKEDEFIKAVKAIYSKPNEPQEGSPTGI